ncbi:hypothetical protein [Dactylosporangium sp. CA-233914]|uniref:hypothetical protein n=1 Tax=Dactylosporangium sp. CA-233914 TaxID=3239934 RepID=UPI003D8A4B50
MDDDRQVFAGILHALRLIIEPYAAANPRIEVFRMAYALVDGLPRVTLLGLAAEATRQRQMLPGRPGRPGQALAAAGLHGHSPCGNLAAQIALLYVERLNGPFPSHSVGAGRRTAPLHDYRTGAGDPHCPATGHCVATATQVGVVEVTASPRAGRSLFRKPGATARRVRTTPRTHHDTHHGRNR